MPHPEKSCGYLKSVIIFHPFYLSTDEISCIQMDCTGILKPSGWASNPSARYIHGIDSGNFSTIFIVDSNRLYFFINWRICSLGKYLVQGRFQCAKCSKYCLAADTITNLSPLIAKQLSVTLTEKSGIMEEMLASVLDDMTTGKSFGQIGSCFETKRITRLVDQILI